MSEEAKKAIVTQAEQLKEALHEFATALLPEEHYASGGSVSEGEMRRRQSQHTHIEAAVEKIVASLFPLPLSDQSTKSKTDDEHNGSVT